MIARCILKVIGVLTLVSISIVALTVILLVGWFLLTMIFPNRMNVTGRVTDRAGRPIKAAQVHAVPLPIICHLSTVICQLSSVVLRLSSFVCQLPSVLCRLSSVVCQATGTWTSLHLKMSFLKKKNRTLFLQKPPALCRGYVIIFHTGSPATCGRG